MITNRPSPITVTDPEYKVSVSLKDNPYFIKVGSNINEQNFKKYFEMFSSTPARDYTLVDGELSFVMIMAHDNYPHKVSLATTDSLYECFIQDDFHAEDGRKIEEIPVFISRIESTTPKKKNTTKK